MEKPRFKNLYTTHNVGAEHLAAIAGVPVDVIDRMLTDRRVFQGQAEKVLAAFSKLTGETYTLDTVYVYLHIADPSEVERIRQHIQEEYTSAKLGLQGFAEESKHAFITKRMERVGRLVEKLSDLIGKDSALEFFISLDVPKQEGRNIHAWSN